MKENKVHKQGNKYQVIFDGEIIKEFDFKIRDTNTQKLAKKKAFKLFTDLSIKRSI